MATFWKTLRLGAVAMLVLGGTLQADFDGTFEAVGPLPAKNSLAVVVFDEYINFTCPHCNNFRQVSKPLKEKLGKRLKINYIPVLFRGQTDFPLRLYYLAQAEGRGEEIKDMIFDAAFGPGVNIYDPAVVSYLARSAGLGEKFAQQGQAEWVTEKIRQGLASAGNAGVRATPTVVLQGAMRLSPESGMQAFVANLEKLIGQLLTTGK